jgi:hypothetical protein
MSFTYTPGTLVVDETDTFGERVHLGSDVLSWPDSTRWLERVRHWLDEISRTTVGRALLESMQARPTPGTTLVKIVRSARSNPEAYTDGIVPAASANNPGAQPTIFITFTPADARSGPMDMGPMRHPGAVLAHELTHALMAIHGLNSLLTATGSPSPVGGWTSAAYPNHNEFCATTVQNMLLSETGSLLSDGYDPADSADDPWIVTTRPASASPTAFGMSAITRVDTANFVAAYRGPLDFLASSLPRFTSRLAALDRVAFNPFAYMRSHSRGSGSATTRGGASGGARPPVPIDISPHD